MLLNKNGRVPTLVEKLAYAAPDLTLSLLRRNLQRATESPDKTADLVKFACALATQGTTPKDVHAAGHVLRLVMEPGLQTPGVGETLYDAVATVAKNMVRLAPGTDAGLQLADQFLEQCVAKAPPGSSQQPDGTPLRPGDVLLPNLAYGTAMFVALLTGQRGGTDTAYRSGLIRPLRTPAGAQWTSPYTVSFMVWPLPCPGKQGQGSGLSGVRSTRRWKPTTGADSGMRFKPDWTFWMGSRGLPQAGKPPCRLWKDHSLRVLRGWPRPFARNLMRKPRAKK